MRFLLFLVDALLAVPSVSGFAPAPIHIRTSLHRSIDLFATATDDITGTVKWYNIERGYGFIAVDDGGPDMYVHATGLETDRPLKDGDHVRFLTEIDRRTNKPKAVSVELLGADVTPTPEVTAPAPAIKKQDLSPKAETKTSSVNPNQRALLEAKLQNDKAAQANVKKLKSLQDEKIHRSLLEVKLQNDRAAKANAAARADAEKASRIAAEKAAEEARLAEEAEEKRLAEEAERARIAAEKAKAEEEARLAKEAEEKRLAEEAERARIAAEKAKAEEEARLAKEAEEKRIAQEKAAKEEALKQTALKYGCDDVETYKARIAHLDDAEEAKLASKYAAISDLGERFFTILADLRMIDLHLDPDDPNVVIDDEDE